MDSLTDILQRYRERVEQALDHFLPTNHTLPARLHAAMRYATLNGGKRIRASLVYATGEALGADPADMDAPACAVELVHSYSLVHDDLPCMDDDALRRGQASCHVAYDEATALLVGDALQSLAFDILARDNGSRLPAESRLGMLGTLAAAIGSQGMAGGQAIDLAAVGQQLDLEQVQTMHQHKTGALIHASVMLGLLASPTGDEQAQRHLGEYANAIGLLFQVIDDILDVEGDTHILGKVAGADQARAKPTYVALLGLPQAKSKAKTLHARALESLAFLGDNRATLAGIADFILERTQ